MINYEIDLFFCEMIEVEFLFLLIIFGSFYTSIKNIFESALPVNLSNAIN